MKGAPREKNSPWATLVYFRRTQKWFHWYSPLTCCSSVIITSTAILRMPSFVWGLSVLRCDVHIRPNSLSASLISRILILMIAKRNRYLNYCHIEIHEPHLSRALLACLRSFSLRSFSLGSMSSSSSSSSPLEQLRDVLLLSLLWIIELDQKNGIKNASSWKFFQEDAEIMLLGSTHYRLCLFCPLALLAADPLTAWLLLGFVSASGGSFRFSAEDKLLIIFHS